MALYKLQLVVVYLVSSLVFCWCLNTEVTLSGGDAGTLRCGAGMGLSVSGVLGLACQPCPVGYHSTHDSFSTLRLCTACTTCHSKDHLLQECNRTHDTVCRSSSEGKSDPCWCAGSPVGGAKDVANNAHAQVGDGNRIPADQAIFILFGSVVGVCGLLLMAMFLIYLYTRCQDRKRALAARSRTRASLVTSQGPALPEWTGGKGGHLPEWPTKSGNGSHHNNHVPYSLLTN